MSCVATRVLPGDRSSPWRAGFSHTRRRVARSRARGAARSASVPARPVTAVERGTAMVFSNRVDAGRRLAERLQHLRGDDVVVLGLPRGGVPVALEVAESLGAPLDVIVVRKLGVPS